MKESISNCFEIETFRCHKCRHPISIPIRAEWNSPLYIMQMEREHKALWNQIDDMKKSLYELAEECVDAGVRPEILKRADEMKQLLQSMLDRLRNEEDEG